MAINFNQNSVWNLKPISVDSVKDTALAAAISSEALL